MSGDLNEASLAIGELKNEVKHLASAVATLNQHVENLNKTKYHGTGFMAGISATVSIVVIVISNIFMGRTH